MAFDFDRAAAVMAALSSKPVSPRSLNPYRSGSGKQRYTREDLQRTHRVHVMGGRHIEQVVTMEQVVDNG